MWTQIPPRAPIAKFGLMYVQIVVDLIITLIEYIAVLERMTI